MSVWTRTTERTTQTTTQGFIDGSSIFTSGDQPEEVAEALRATWTISCVINATKTKGLANTKDGQNALHKAFNVLKCSKAALLVGGILGNGTVGAQAERQALSQTRRDKTVSYTHLRAHETGAYL
eukprot:6139167-Pyramimonas_sp.AAC.1